MILKKNILPLLFVFLVCICQWATSSPALAYNFTYVDADTGEPIGWEPGTTIQYYLDPGDFGRLTNVQAHTLLKEAMRIWEETPYATVPHFEFAGYLPLDVNADNYENYIFLDTCYTSNLNACKTDYQKNLQTIIIFDNDNSILNNELCLIGGCRAHSAPDVLDGDFFKPGRFRQGHMVFGGDILAGETADIVGIFVHEIGHLLGLAHPSLNQQLLISSVDDIIDPSAYLPSMHTSFLFRHAVNPHTDDIAGIQTLYPTDDAQIQLGSIRGVILKSDGTPMTHANVIARNTTDPWCLAYSYISGRRCDASTTSDCELYGKTDGSFSIDSLPPGSYTIEVEGFSEELDNYNLSVSPMIIDGDLPGNAEFWNDGDGVDEDPLAFTLIALAAGQIRDDINIKLNDTQYHDNYSVMIPADDILVVFATSCVEDTTDWNSLAGIEPADNGNNADSTPAAGCSLVVPRH